MKSEIHVNINRDITSDLMKFNVQVEAALSIQLESRKEDVVWKKNINEENIPNCENMAC